MAAEQRLDVDDASRQYLCDGMGIEEYSAILDRYFSPTGNLLEDLDEHGGFVRQLAGWIRSSESARQRRNAGLLEEVRAQFGAITFENATSLYLEGRLNVEQYDAILDSYFGA